MQRPIAKPIGTRREVLDTPALLLDVEQLEANLATLVGPVRVEAWLHGTPAIAQRELAQPGVVGIAVRGIAEAEVFAAAGCADIRILRPLATVRVAPPRRSAGAVGARGDGGRWRAALRHRGAGRRNHRLSPRWQRAGNPGGAIHDCGQKAIGRDFGEPRIVRPRPSFAPRQGAPSTAWCNTPWTRSPTPSAIWLELTPADIATAFALHDFVYATRAGRLAAVWPVSARGAFQ